MFFCLFAKNLMKQQWRHLTQVTYIKKIAVKQLAIPYCLQILAIL